MVFWRKFLGHLQKESFVRIKPKFSLTAPSSQLKEWKFDCLNKWTGSSHLPKSIIHRSFNWQECVTDQPDSIMFPRTRTVWGKVWINKKSFGRERYGDGWIGIQAWIGNIKIILEK